MKSRNSAGGSSSLRCKSFVTGGYTIIEILVVLTVTTALFLVVSIMFSGKQGQVEANQSARDLESKIQNIANDVANGYYYNGISCTGTNNGSNQVSVSSLATSAGSNSGCVFLGKIVSFNSFGSTIYSAVGWQFTGATGASPTTSSLSEAKPVLVTVNPEDYTFKYSLAPTHIYDIASGAEYGAIAFMTQLGQASGGSNPLTGSKATLLYGINGSTVGDSASQLEAQVNTDSNFVLLAQGVRICLVSGNGKPVEITVGAGGNQVGTNVLIDNGVSNACA